MLERLDADTKVSDLTRACVLTRSLVHTFTLMCSRAQAHREMLRAARVWRLVGLERKDLLSAGTTTIASATLQTAIARLVLVLLTIA
jgi:hypothetical protein